MGEIKEEKSGGCERGSKAEIDLGSLSYALISFAWIKSKRTSKGASGSFPWRASMGARKITESARIDGKSGIRGSNWMATPRRHQSVNRSYNRRGLTPGYSWGRATPGRANRGSDAPEAAADEEPTETKASEL